MEIAILVVAAATLGVTCLLFALAQADATTQRKIREAADATRLAAEASARTANLTHEQARRDYRRRCLLGLEAALVELAEKVAVYPHGIDAQGVAGIQAQMMSYLADLPGDNLPKSSGLAGTNTPWTQVSTIQADILNARIEVHSALGRKPVGDQRNGLAL